MSDSALKLGNEVLNFVRMNGPVLPVHVGERFGYNTIISSAVLSDLVSKGLIKFSNAKIGGSPIYFVPGQEPKLQILYKYLGEKPRKIFDMLRDSRVLRDKSLEPWQRVAVREIKDFSVMLKVNYAGNEEVFWKWYLAPDTEAKTLIAEIIRSELVSPPEEKKEEEVQKPLTEQPSQNLEPIEDVAYQEPPSELQKELRSEGKKVDKPKKLKKQKLDTKFYELIKDYFASTHIKILEESAIRKNLELNFVVNIPSSVGPLKFFVIAKNKKLINDSELSLAYSQSQLRKLPVLFLSTGDISKKAASYLEANLKGYLSFKKIGS